MSSDDLLKKWKQQGAIIHNDSEHGHPKHMSRRELLGQGFITGATIGLAPSLISMCMNDAHAQAAINCGGGNAAAAGAVPMLIIDLGGGTAIAGGNVKVGGAAGQKDSLNAADYAGRLGYLKGDYDQIDETFGLAFHHESGLLQGMLNMTSVETQAGVDGFIFCSRTANDTSNNQQNPIYQVGAIAGKGRVGHMAGNSTEPGGGRQNPPTGTEALAPRPSRIVSTADLSNLSSAEAPQDKILKDDSKKRVLAAIEKLSEEQRKKLALPGGEAKMLQEVLGCSYQDASKLLDPSQGAGAFDVMSDTVMVGTSRTYNGQFDQRASRQQAIIHPDDFRTRSNRLRNVFNRASTMAKALVEGVFNVGLIEFGGYDYHNSTRRLGNVRDMEAGVAIGIALEYAARRGVPIVISVISDGSVFSNGVVDNSGDSVDGGLLQLGGRGNGIWRGDNSDTSTALQLMYNPAGRAQSEAIGGKQLGAFLKGQGIIDRNAVKQNAANDPRMLSWVLALNYAALAGKVTEFMALPGNPIAAGNVNDLIMYDVKSPLKRGA